MRTFLALAAICTLMAGAAVTSAHAIPITFSTEASFNGDPWFSSNPSYPLYPQGAYGSLEFIGVPNGMTDTDLGTFSLGAFKVTGTYGATGETYADSLPFAIKVTYSSPLSTGSDTVGGFLTGSFGVAGVPAEVTKDWSTLKVTFTDDTLVIGNWVYTVLPMTKKLHHDPQSVYVAVPEPSTLLLVGTALGLTGLAGLVRRRRR